MTILKAFKSKGYCQKTTGHKATFQKATTHEPTVNKAATHKDTGQNLLIKDRNLLNNVTSFFSALPFSVVSLGLVLP